MYALELDRPEVAESISGAMPEIELEVSHRTSERTFFRVWFRGEVLLTHWDPEPAACRKLLEMGVTGRLAVRWRGTARVASVRNIEVGAKWCSAEGRRQTVRTVSFQPFERGETGDDDGQALG